MIGQTKNTLGAAPDDIADHADGVHPGTGGMSVSDRLTNLPGHRLPIRLRDAGVAKASGNNKLTVWTLGDGAFESGPINELLRLRQDPRKVTHGFIEPAAVMSRADYQGALAATQAGWVADEVIHP